MAEVENSTAAKNLWRVSHDDVVLYFDDEKSAKHNYDAFARAGMRPTIDTYIWASCVKD